MDTSSATALWTLVGAALVVILTRVQRRLWFRGYWTFGDLLTGFEYVDRPGVLALLVKMAIGAVAGLAAGLGTGQSEHWVGAFAAAFGALALVWPVFASTDAIPPYVFGRTQELRVMYAMGVVSYGALGFVGGLAAGFVKGAAETPGIGGFLAARGESLLDGLIVAAVLLLISTLYWKWANGRAHAIREEAERAGIEPPVILEIPPEVQDPKSDRD